ncbi:Putative ribonuclease H protein, partial [Glycine soja]
RVVKKLVCIQRSFLWGDGDDQHKIAWVKWETVCLPKDKGGLGIKDITKFNLALLAKWKWNLFHHNGELWARILESKYGADTTSDSHTFSGIFPSISGELFLLQQHVLTTTRTSTKRIGGG